MTHAFFVRKQDQGEYEVSIVNEVNRALSHLFTEEGFDVVEIEFLEAGSNGLINLEAFKDDFRTGEDIDTTTLVNAVKRLKELGIPYLAVGTLDILSTDIDPVSGYYRTYVMVTGQMKSLVSRFPRIIASVGPYQYAGLGSSPAEARRNALNIAAEKGAAYMVYFCCKF